MPDEYKNTATLRGHEHSISSVRFLPGDLRVASAGRDNTLRIWDVQSTFVYAFNSTWEAVLMLRIEKPLYKGLAATW